MTAPFRTPVVGAMVAPFHVLVIGGGIGGLCLAQGLKRVGISVAVYERDRTPTDRLQGYRVHISPAGSRALHACLPPHLFELFDRTCGKPGRAFHFMTEDMQVLLALEGELMAEQQRDPIAKHRAVSRITLRYVLLSGLDDVVHLGKTFTRYEERGDGRIVAHFEDGSSAEGDILVAADGGGSRVRRQFLPQAERIDTGVIGIAGKVFLDATSRARLAPALLDGLTLVAAKGGLGLFAAIQDFDGTALDGIAAHEASPSTGNLFNNTRSYLMWALSGKRARLGLVGGAEKLDSAALASPASGQRGNSIVRAHSAAEDARERAGDTRPEPGSSARAALAAAAARAIAGWAKGFRDLVDLSDPTTISCLPIRTSLPVMPWPTGRITLIGDAIHSMTPYRGIGANIALKDAVRLRDALVAAQRNEVPLLDAIAGYESAMRDYGFKAVRNSLQAMQQTTGQGPIAMALSRTAFRLIDRLPPLKRQMARGMSEE
jgi:2-polyprenyl-6-methoxyphenol hydroxylase-like FAD-dependent oxidoreductase